MKNLKLTLILFMTFVLGVCSAQDATIEFVVDMNGVDQPSADYALVTVNGSWNGWTGFGAELFDADADGVYTGSLDIAPGTTFEYVAAVSGEADGYSGWGLQWGDGCGGANVVVTAGAAGSVTTTTLTPGCADVLGCMDANATNYDAAATEQAFDQYLNSSCLYASCEDIPEYGCIYVDGFGAFNATFGAAQCIEYGGTPCEEPAGCTDPLFVEFDPTASVDDGSCSVFVVEGCVYTDADNYDVSANTDDGSCLFTLGSTCPGDFTGDGFVNVSDLGGFLGAFGNACE